MLEYNAMPDRTVEAWRDFWLHTGDGGRQDQDGYFYLVDRIKDTIRRRGENLSYLAGRKRNLAGLTRPGQPRRVRRRRHIGPIRAPPPPSPVRRKTLIFLAFPTYIDLAQRLLYF